MKFKTKITRSQYIRLMFAVTYKKPVTIFLSIAGVAMLILWILLKIGATKFGEANFIQLVFGLLALVFIPFSVYRSAAKTYDASSRLQQEAEFEITDEMIISSGPSFNNETDLASLVKIDVVSDFYLVYSSQQPPLLIPFHSMTAGEREAFENTFEPLFSHRRK